MLVTQKSTTTTAMKGVFAGGDATGDSVTVVQAMASGKCAAAGIDTYVKGLSSVKASAETGKVKLNLNLAALASSTRERIPDLPNLTKVS